MKKVLWVSAALLAASVGMISSAQALTQPQDLYHGYIAITVVNNHAADKEVVLSVSEMGGLKKQNTTVHSIESTHDNLANAKLKYGESANAVYKFALNQKKPAATDAIFFTVSHDDRVCKISVPVVASHAIVSASGACDGIKTPATYKDKTLSVTINYN